MATKSELDDKKGREQNKKAARTNGKSDQDGKKTGKEDTRVIKEGAGYCIGRKGVVRHFSCWRSGFQVFSSTSRWTKNAKERIMPFITWGGGGGKGAFSQKVVGACHPSAHPSFWDQCSARLLIQTLMRN